MKKLLYTLLLFPLFLSCAEKKKQDEFLHVSSPEWQDQILYFIVTDRFEDGDSTNNDQGTGEYKKGHGGFWNGGDFKGITQKLDYIKELGATGIWITPPVANQWRNPQKTGTGNHGYWASSFVEVDKHYGTLEEYKELSRTLHKNDMYLIQDVVVNHLGDFYTYTGPYNPDDVTQNFKKHKVSQPTQYPFMHNDANNPKDREMAIYHFAPNFYDHSDTLKKRQYQFADLDDLNTSNPIVRKALRNSYNYWIEEVGVDGYRFDTPHMVEHDFWKDFLHSTDTEDPGIHKFASQVGKKDFVTFGETAIFSQPYDNKGPLEAAAYIGTEEHPEMTSILNFPLYNSIQRVFQELKPTNLMTFRLESTQEIFRQPELLFNFIDNHDGARFLTKADKASFRQALLFIMTIPGVPVIYYGTEQELKGMRQSMFKGGADSPDRDYFDTQSESFKFMQDLIRLRKEQEVLRRGELRVLRDNTGGPGVFVYEMKDEDQTALILFNTSESEKLAFNIPTGFEPGTLLEASFSLSSEIKSYQVESGGQVNITLSGKEAMVLVDKGNKSPVSDQNRNIKITSHVPKTIQQAHISLTGKASNLTWIELAIDGKKLSNPIEVDADGLWAADLSLSNLVNAKHRITAFSSINKPGQTIASDFIEFKVEFPAKLIASYQDPTGDDQGPKGKYTYPTHPSFRDQMDIEAVKVYSLGNNLRIELKMAEITQIWLPPNGFDHLLANIYIDIHHSYEDEHSPVGARVLPFQHAEMPGQVSWDYLLSTAGFSNALFTSEGASKNQNGKASGPAPAIHTNPSARTISFDIAAEALGNPTSLAGSKIYICTWDGSPGSPRGLSPQAQTWSMGGGTDSDPKIMDDTELIVLEDR